ncbi:MAG: hypothetical protein K9J25_05365 [Bacteroidales bacterium]|nr:hypothetical protein [Bacteroidales bacterium]
MRHKKLRNVIVLVILLVACFTGVFAQVNAGDSRAEIKEPVPGIFEGSEVFNITLKFDVTEFMRKKSDKDYLDAEIIFHYSESDSASYDIKLRARGERRREICRFPPIRLNFKNTKTIFGDIDSMKNVKMVTHCNMAKVYDEYVMKEFLIYKMYNYITDYSFRVRLFRVNYVDTGRRGRNYQKYGFLIEPLDLLEKRLNVFEIENVPLKYDDMVPDILDRMTIFQFMIGNPDWQVASYHNIKVVKGREQLKGVPVAYDFDYSGMVNTSYALPAEVLEIANVRQRVHLGACRDDTTYARILGEFMDNRENFYKTIDNCIYLDENSKNYMIKYLDSFYDLYTKDRIISMLKMTCVN